ncbi:hypothetical protein NECAME_03368 [Necator americanus]|uniref:Uncharacterized protein n=1 Tax=Necator americanus TaxID=51031 RepID=W2T524_NECAM|nr:hypothetical protein NECAME_03368 [Necator americanus]ETN76699.1 hypothetical protein NECAME_03368 [Necator americanus]
MESHRYAHMCLPKGFCIRGWVSDCGTVTLKEVGDGLAKLSRRRYNSTTSRIQGNPQQNSTLEEKQVKRNGRNQQEDICMFEQKLSNEHKESKEKPVYSLRTTIYTEERHEGMRNCQEV